MDTEQARKIIQGLAGTLKGLRLYPLRHPAIERQLQALLGSLAPLFQKPGAVIRLGLTEGSLFLNDHLFVEPLQASEEVSGLLRSLDLDGLELFQGLGLDELSDLLDLLNQGKAKGPAFEQALRERQIRHIRPWRREQAEEVRERPRQVYSRALKVVDQIFQDVRLGKIPSSTEAMEVVQGLVRITLAEPQALFALSMLKDYDNYTFTHSVNVSVIALAVGRACGLGEEDLRILGMGGLLHDLGKLRIDHAIIAKPGPLNEREMAKIREHPVTGAQIVSQMAGIPPQVVDIILGHHRRHDRRGYPEQASSGNLSPMAEMAAIADTYDAITTLRSYQRPMTPRKAVQRLRELAGSHLNREWVERFVASLGTYPVGSLVRLDSNEIGLVVWVDTRDPDSVRLKLLFDAAGQKVDPPPRLDLPGGEACRIVAEVDPFVKGIDVTAYFDWSQTETAGSN